MLRKNKIFITFFVILVVLIILNLFIKFMYLEKNEIKINLDVGDHIGFNIDNEELNFGTVTPGNHAIRNITLSSNRDFDVKVKIKVNKYKSWYSVSENDFVLNKGDNRTIVVRVDVPGDVNYGKYDAKLIMTFWKTI